jgi:lipopolysaccharide cholinephosphotransferase
LFSVFHHLSKENSQKSLNSIQGKIDNLQESLNLCLDQLDRRQNELDAGVITHFDQLRNEYNARLDRIDQKQNELDTGVITYFDQLRNEYNVRLDRIERRQSELGTGVITHFDQLRNEYNVRLDQIDRRQNELSQEIDAKGIHNEMMFWQLYRRSDESVKDAQKRFFASLPKAEGNLRVLQMTESALLKKLVEICRKNGLKIWLRGGTLLGAYRHQGFIPWDDDIDTSMMRDDLKRLEEILKNDPEYRLNFFYDFLAKSRTFRFCYRDEKIPCFVDVFYYDYGMDDSAETWARRQQLRNDLVQKLDEDIPELRYWREKKFIVPGEEGSELIQEFFDEYRKKMEDSHVLVEKEEAKSIVFAIENVSIVFRDISSMEDIYPMPEMSFEGNKYDVAKDCMTFLSNSYNDIYRLPNDIFQHEHIAQDEMSGVLNNVH